jgi:hypothetical protein
MAEETDKPGVAERLELVRQRYGQWLDDEALEQVRVAIESVVELAEELRSATLNLSHEPLSAFVPYRKEA